MKKNLVKIILDIIMSLLLLLMYSKSVISISFHELGGLAVCGLFLIHKGLNWKWIVVVSKRLFDKSLPIKTKLGYVVNVLLFVCMTFIALSGIMISKTILTSISGQGMFWKMGHFFASAIAIVLVGIHIGLHWSFIKNMFAKMLTLPHSIAKPLGVMCLTATLIYGGYNTVTSNFSRWFTSPFMAASIPSGEMPQKGEQFGEISQKGGKNLEGMPQRGEKPEGIRQKGAEGTVKPEGQLMKQGEIPGSSSLNFGRMIDVITSYGSITAVFATLTILVEKMLKRKNQVAIMKV